MRLQPEVRISLGVLLSFSLVALGAVFAYFNTMRAIEYGKSVEKSFELLAAMESLLQVIRANQRYAYKFASTGDPLEQEKYRSSAESVAPHLEFIKGLASTDSRRYLLLTSLETQVSGFSNLVSGIVQSRLESDSNQVLPGELKTELEERYDYIRGRVLYIEGEEKELLKRRISLQERETRALFSTYALLGFACFVLLVFLLLALTRYVRTTRKAAEAERRVADSIFLNSPVGIVVLDRDLNVVTFNPVFADTYGPEQSAALKGKPVTEIFSDVQEGSGKFIRELASSRVLQSEYADFAEQLIFADRFHDFILWPLLDGAEPRGFVLLFVDVTEKVTANKQKQLLFNTFTHDMKNPLIGNQYLLKALKQIASIDAEESQTLVEQIVQGNNDVLRMIANVLELAKIQSGKQFIAQSSFDLGLVIEECVSDLSSLARQRDVTIEIQLPGGGMEIVADRVLLKLLVMNLLNNAIKFSPEGDSVSLIIEKDESTARIIVQDHGPGIPFEERKKLFRSAWQGEIGKKVPGGTGIGLFLCGQIIKVLNGSIIMNSEDREGSIFEVELPLDLSLDKLS
ncbi:PAS domain-containing protein [bacterium]|nr:PAS domain-containing protein [bacterium]